MPEPSQGTNVVLAIKKQADVDTQASGSGATLIEVLPGPGLSRAAASIESAVISRTGMKRKPRQGSITGAASYDTELVSGALQIVYAGVLGGDATAAADLSETDLTSCTITGTGVTVTFGGGDLIALGFFPGRVIQFTNLSVAGNNAKNVPILAVDNTAKTLTLPSGILADNAIDSAFNVHLYKAYTTPNPRLHEYYTVEEYLSDLDTPDSILGTGFKFTGINIQGQSNQPIKATFTLSGINVAPMGGGAPNFTSPVSDATAGHDQIIGLDGALYVDGAAPAFDVTAVQLGLSANASSTPLLFSRVAKGVSVGQFGMTAQLTGLVTDLAAMQASVDDDQVSMFFWFKDPQGGFDSIYVGNASYGGVQVPIAELDSIQTIPVYGGRDTRGGAYAETTWVICTSAT